MEILIVGHTAHLEEARQKFGDAHGYKLAESQMEPGRPMEKCDVVFDFTIGNDPFQIRRYQDRASLIVFLNASTISLAQLSTAKIQNTLFGFCGMPGFLNREILEVSMSNENDLEKLNEVCNELKTNYRVVADRVGLVTPRVICMIINEAYYTVQEGTATREDIDKAMKLGTNYPFGPFEWAQRIGVKNVCGLLQAVYSATQDQRYRINSMLIEESNAV